MRNQSRFGAVEGGGAEIYSSRGERGRRAEEAAVYSESSIVTNDYEPDLTMSSICSVESLP